MNLPSEIHRAPDASTPRPKPGWPETPISTARCVWLITSITLTSPSVPLDQLRV
ncbi:MAG: hypothetical protein OEY45_07205 [Gammaproteobacteria bacterium]|nr:hypothetical protein [Gammaproteobacteria bacterium]MDH5514931.1 hypothetical protein [Gammaproteobacteria bacterium]